MAWYIPMWLMRWEFATGKWRRFVDPQEIGKFRHRTKVPQLRHASFNMVRKGLWIRATTLPLETVDESWQLRICVDWKKCGTNCCRIIHPISIGGECILKIANGILTKAGYIANRNIYEFYAEFVRIDSRLSSTIGSKFIHIEFRYHPKFIAVIILVSPGLLRKSIKFLANLLWILTRLCHNYSNKFEGLFSRFPHKMGQRRPSNEVCKPTVAHSLHFWQARPVRKLPQITSEDQNNEGNGVTPKDGPSALKELKNVRNIMCVAFGALRSILYILGGQWW